jgi:hypothetical protein
MLRTKEDLSSTLQQKVRRHDLYHEMSSSYSIT